MCLGSLAEICSVFVLKVPSSSVLELKAWEMHFGECESYHLFGSHVKGPINAEVRSPDMLQE